MDPATAIGTASAVLSFATFASGLVSGAVRIYRQGTLTENATLEDVVDEMGHYLATVKKLRHDHKCVYDNDDMLQLEQTLGNIVDAAVHVLEKLRGHLNTLKVRHRSKPGALWASLTASWRNICNGDDKTALVSQLDSLVGKITALLGTLTETKVDALMQTTQGIYHSMQGLETSLSEWKQEALREISANQNKAWDDICIDSTLYHLRYDGMRARSGRLEKNLYHIESSTHEHRDAFSWVFARSDTGPDNVISQFEERSGTAKVQEREEWRQAKAMIHTWLHSDSDNVLHILGKPGAGKSTFVEFLFSHDETKNSLMGWAGASESAAADSTGAGRQRLVMIKYYFSILDGGPVQHQLDGLYRTVLHDILAENRHAVPDALPGVWSKLRLSRVGTNTDGSRGKQELLFEPGEIAKATINILLRRLPALDSIKLCIFIDGLDEFRDDMKDTQDLVDELNCWTRTISNTKTKVCLTSREEPPFTDRLFHHMHFRLQAVTMHDMTLYATARLRDIASSEAEAAKIAALISSRSEGVFLWVHLVLGAVRRKLHLYKDSQVIMEIIGRFPTGLRDMIAGIVASIDEADRETAYSVFRMIEAAQQYYLEMSPLALSFLRMYKQNSEFAVHPAFELDRTAVEAFLAQADITEMEIPYAFRGLFEVRGKDKAVVLLHRSVKDYLSESNATLIPEDAVLSRKDPPFNAHDAASNLLLAQLQCSAERCRYEAKGSQHSQDVHHPHLFNLKKFSQFAIRLTNMRFSQGLDNKNFAFLRSLQSLLSEELDMILQKSSITPRLMAYTMGNRYGRSSDHNYRVSLTAAFKGSQIDCCLHSPMITYVFNGLYNYPKAELLRHPEWISEANYDMFLTLFQAVFCFNGTSSIDQEDCDFFQFLLEMAASCKPHSLLLSSYCPKSLVASLDGSLWALGPYFGFIVSYLAQRTGQLTRRFWVHQHRNGPRLSFPDYETLKEPRKKFTRLWEVFLDVGINEAFTVSIEAEPDDDDNINKRLKEISNGPTTVFRVSIRPLHGSLARHAWEKVAVPKSMVASLSHDHWLFRVKNWSAEDLVADIDPDNKDRLLKLLQTNRDKQSQASDGNAQADTYETHLEMSTALTPTRFLTRDLCLVMFGLLGGILASLLVQFYRAS